MLQHRRRRKPVSEINVVPYLDVMLVLLVVFMVTAPMLTQGEKVDLPDAKSKPLNVKKDEVVLVISIKEDASYRMDLGRPEDLKKSFSLKDVLIEVGRLMRQNPTLPVLIEGDEKVAYGAVIHLMSTLQQAGVPDVGLVTEPATS